ncbi:MAG: YeeE/YedE thiosulfate transporter family protein [Prolixibacteraceae bacterium]|jgi:hypothetical protein|nr:YeeE/YedE thiosulfate transporter family protein [Prolixibacteraceae bacterium]
MGPLVPYIISNEFNLVIALIIGVFFGFVLEQAGFSSTKKLVGLFYGYDFTVLRVFFTAGVTAMVGVLLFHHFGILDISIIYINPTFLRSALIGGTIMGLGFILGGFCPGTSVCAAAIGKMDAMVFVLGSFIGVFAFTESYPLIKDFYLADAWGPVTMFEMLGISKLAFALVLTFVAVFAFVATWFVEKKVRKEPATISKSRGLKYAVASLMPFVVVAIVAFVPGRQEIIQNRIAEAQRLQECVFYEISADELANEIIHNHYKINVIDVRSPEAFEQFHLPMAMNIPINEITNRKWEVVFNQDVKTNIFYANDSMTVRMACLKSRFVGDAKNLILMETASEFKSMFYDVEQPDLATASKQEINEYNFRSNALLEMEQLIDALKNIGQPVMKEVQVASGGC